MFVIAGATGHVGGVAARRLLATGKPVRVIVRTSEKGGPWAARGADVAVGDIVDPGFLERALEGGDGFFTLIPPDHGAPDVFAAQRRVADSVSAGVRASRVPHVVLLSSLGAELTAGTGPIKGLHYFEECLRETGARVTALRAAYFQENAASAIEPAKTAGIFPNFADRDDVAWPMVATRDIGEEAARALLRPPAANEVIDLVGPDYSARDVAAALGRALGRTLHIVNIPRDQWASTLRQAGLPPDASEKLAEMYGALASGIIRPKGDRLVRATTPLSQTVSDLVTGH